MTGEPIPYTPTPDPDAVIWKAVIRASEDLGITQAALATTLGVSAATISRYKSVDKPVWSKESKERENAVLLIRLYRSLRTIFVSTYNIKEWMNSYNHYLKVVPSEGIKRNEGLVNAVQYLDAMRGRM